MGSKPCSPAGPSTNILGLVIEGDVLDIDDATFHEYALETKQIRWRMTKLTLSPERFLKQLQPQGFFRGFLMILYAAISPARALI